MGFMKDGGTNRFEKDKGREQDETSVGKVLSW